MQAMRHLLHPRARCRRGLASPSEAAALTDMAALTPDGDQRLSPGRRILRNIRPAQVNHCRLAALGATEFLRQRIDRLDHR